jgi:hypothetical protein
MKNYYKILGLNRAASDEDIKHAFRTLAQKYHPDRDPSPNAQTKFSEINEAYRTLSNETKRNIYNYDLKRSEEAPTQPSTPPSYEPPRDSAYRRPEYYQSAQYHKSPPRPKFKIPPWLRPIIAFFQLLAEIFIGMAVGVGIVLLKNIYVGAEQALPTMQMILGITMGGLAGLCLTRENELEYKLKNKMKDGYILLRSLGAVLSGAFFGAALAETVAFTFDTTLSSTLRIGTALGSFLFGLAANGERLWARFRTPGKQFEIVFVIIRAFSIALLVSLIGGLIALMLSTIELTTLTWEGVFYGFIIGTVLGTMQPSDLLAYARYASAYVGRMIVLILILGALVLGALIGMWLRAQEIVTLF